MGRVKAFVITMAVFVVIVTLLVLSMKVKSQFDFTLYDVIVSGAAGWCVESGLEKFYRRLRRQ